MQVTFKVTDLFFDRDAIKQHLGVPRARALMVAGAYIQRKAKDLLRRGKKAAKPGKPPKKHSSAGNLRSILFFPDPATDSLVVGSVKLAGQLRDSNRATVPELMEMGGEAEITEYQLYGDDTWVNLDEFRKAKYRGKRFRMRRRRAQYAPHPYMEPALQIALPQIPDKFRDLI